MGRNASGTLRGVDREAGLLLTGIGLTLLSAVLPWFTEREIGTDHTFSVHPGLALVAFPLSMALVQLGAVVRKNSFVAILTGIATAAYLVFFLGLSWTWMSSPFLPFPPCRGLCGFVTATPDGPAIGLLVGLTGSLLATAAAVVWWKRDGLSARPRRAVRT